MLRLMGKSSIFLLKLSTWCHKIVHHLTSKMSLNIGRYLRRETANLGVQTRISYLVPVKMALIILPMVCGSWFGMGSSIRIGIPVDSSIQTVMV